MIRELLLKKKIFEAEAEVDKFLQEHEIDLESNTVIQSLIFDKEAFQSEAEVREWAKDHGFVVPKVDEEEGTYRVRQFSPQQFIDDSFKTIEIRRGIQAVVGEIMMNEEAHFNDKGEELMSCSKIDTLDLSEGMPHIIEIARVAEGEHPAYGKLKITQEHLEAMERNFNSKVTGVDLAVNEDHRKNEAFGWFKDVFLSFDKQTLYGQVQWNRKGIQALSEKEYRYFSPEFRFNYIHPHTGVEHGPTLLGGALTNYPFLKMEAITQLNEKTKEGEIMKNDATTIDLSAHNEKVVELNEKIKDVEVKLSESESKVVELSEKNKELSAKLEKIEKEAVYEKLFSANKINKAQKDALMEGKGMLEVLSLNDGMNTNPKGSDDTPEITKELSEAEKSVCKNLGISEDEFLKIEL